MKSILWVTDKKGRVQYNRAMLLRSYMTDIEVDVVCLGDVRKRSYDLVYYSHFSQIERYPYSGKKIASITSHKCIDSLPQTMRTLKQFDGVSVNNLHLMNFFKDGVKPIFYTPNGVDSEIFSFIAHDRSIPLVLGWSGNRDRAVKNYKSLLQPLMKKASNVEFKVIATSKRDTHKNLLSQDQMKEFYQSLDFFVITSISEGTPNPGLEAMSCGTPCISTKVGNMTEIIQEGKNGFFVEPQSDSLVKAIERGLLLKNDEYSEMRAAVRGSIEQDWRWSQKAIAWIEFFKYFL